jgi:hypothetical protein
MSSKGNKKRTREATTNDHSTTTTNPNKSHKSNSTNKNAKNVSNKVMKCFDIDLAKADVIEEMRSNEDLVWRFFGGQKEIATRMYVLKKIVMLLREKYGRQSSHFKFTSEMFDYFESLASEECKETNEQDFFFFGALLFLPELFAWIKKNQHQIGTASATPLYENKTISISEVSTHTRLKSNKNAYTSKTESSATEQVTNVNVFAMTQFASYINNAIKTNILEIMQGANDYDLDTVVRKLRYEYIAYCGFPVPSAEFMEEWTMHLERKALVETTKDREQDDDSE